MGEQSVARPKSQERELTSGVNVHGPFNQLVNYSVFDLRSDALEIVEADSGCLIKSTTAVSPAQYI